MRLARLFLAGLLAVPLPAAAEVGTPAGARIPAPVPTTVTAPAAQPMPSDHLERMIAARNLIKAGQPADASAMLRPLIVELEDAGDLVALRAAYDLAGLAADGMERRDEAIAARTQLVLLSHILGPADAPGTVRTGRAVAAAHDRDSMGRFHALANLLAAVENARRAGPLSADMAHVAIIVPAQMGQQLMAMGRPELALFFFLRARTDADPVNAAKLDKAIVAARDAIAALPDIALPGPDACMGDKTLPAEQIDACRQAADRAFARGDMAGADRILSNLLQDVPPTALPDARYPAAVDLLLLRLVTREAGDADLIASVGMLANYLAVEGQLPAAALLTARAARTLSDQGLHDPTLVKTCGHIARRAARAGSPDLARRMLTLQRAANLAGAAPAASLARLPEPLIDRHLVDAMLRIEAGHLAAAAGHAHLAEAEWAAADRTIAALDPGTFARITDMTVARHQDSPDFVFPTYAGAVELTGRLALRLPADDPRRDAAQIDWMVALWGIRGDILRAGAIADAMIADIRARPKGRSTALVTVLIKRADMLRTVNPVADQRLTREAYEIVSRQPGRESLRIELLLDLANQQADGGLSRALVAEARKLREATPGIAVETTVRLDMRSALDAFDDGDTVRAVNLAEAALARLVANGNKDKWSIIDSARRLAHIHAAAGRLADARRTYETYILPQTRTARVGEQNEIFYEVDLVTLEAYSAPDRKTLDTLAELLDRAHRRAAPGSDLIRSIRRSQAFAFHGLGMGRQARAAAQEALNTDRPPATDTTSAREDRDLLEALVGASWQAGHTQASP